MAGNDFQDLQAIIGAIPGDRFRFLSAERRRAYAAILWLLLQHRRAHRIEVYYDDLMVESLDVVPGVEPGNYDADTFRADIAQLEDWGNLAPRRLEPRRIETLADRHLRKFLCRLDDETAAILDFLEGRSRLDAAALSGHGSHFLRDAADRLNEALRLASMLRKKVATPPDSGEEAAEDADSADFAMDGIDREGPEDADRAVADHEFRDKCLRVAYLCAEVDRKVDDAARELSAFDAALVAFAVSPFRLEALAEVVERLERYVEDYIAEATERARKLHRTAKKLLGRGFTQTLRTTRDTVDRHLREDPFAAPSAGSWPDPLSVCERLVPFFAPGGQYDLLLERVHAAARDVVKRLHAHIAGVRARNIRIETLRDRSREMARIGEEEVAAANRWVNALFASAHLVTDLRTGTPDDRAPLPRPARRYRVVRGGRAGAYLSSKVGKPGQVRALHRGRLHELGRFVEERILRGEAAAPLSAADLEGIGDARTLMSAVKAHHLRAGRDRRYLSYRIARDKNPRNGERARFAFEEGEFDAPDLLFRRDDGGKS
ncbi:MAG: DUF2397 family protein [Desulfobacteria bacterium]|nr:hypothetical protein [Deltaproteobacteria bacterium]